MGVAVLVLLFELLRAAGVLDSESFPSSREVVTLLISEAGTGAYWGYVAHTAFVWAVGLLVGSLVGTVVGFLLGSNRYAHRATQLLIDAIRPVPMMAMFPLLILLLGTGMRLPIVLVSLSTLWPMIVQADYGVQDVDPVARDAARSYGCGKVRIFFTVSLPSALPYVMTGIRVSAAIGLIVTVGVSLLAGSRGLGAAIAEAQIAAAIPLMYVYILTTGLVALVAMLLVMALERRVLFWHASQRKVVE